MVTVPCDVVHEYEIPPGLNTVRIEAESSGASGHSSSAVTLQIRPGATLRLRFVCLPAQGASDDPASLARSGQIG
jgi:hypothetical protein